MIRSHFRQKEWPRTRKRKLTATVSKPPSDSEEIQVVADVHAAQEPPAPEPPAPEPPASQPAAQGTGAIPKRWTRASASASKSTRSDSDSSVK